MDTQCVFFRLLLTSWCSPRAFVCSVDGHRSTPVGLPWWVSPQVETLRFSGDFKAIVGVQAEQFLQEGQKSTSQPQPRENTCPPAPYRGSELRTWGGQTCMVAQQKSRCVSGPELFH